MASKVFAAAALVAFDGPDPQRSLNDQLGDRLTDARRVLTDGSAIATLAKWVAATQDAKS